MMNEYESLNEHEKFMELSALANSGTLSTQERAELESHLRTCEECRTSYHQYLLLATEGMPILAASLAQPPEQGNWDQAGTRMELLARVGRAEEPPFLTPIRILPKRMKRYLLRQTWLNPVTAAALAACLVVALGVGSYRIGTKRQTAANQAAASSEGQVQGLLTEKKHVNELLDAETKKLSQLAQENTEKDRELARMRSALHKLEQRSDELTAAKTTMDRQLTVVSEDRDALSGQLRETQQAYQNIQVEMARLRAESDKDLVRTASLESKIDELTAMNRNQERRLRDDEQYLASDRDIRELMGARNLYIADVFDVDSSSRTRKPFGRVFYTEGKSLIFYAFDLDRQPGLKNASTFQAWGEKEGTPGKKSPSRNLGILYMDNEPTRRWVLRCNDPGILAEIDAVFVTVEPQGGSPKPTAKPFLYALLRKEANHP